MIEKIEKPVTPLELNSKINEIIDNIAGKSIGEIISVACGSGYVPEGCLPCDGAEYSKSQFPDLWSNYLTTDLLNTCTYEDYATDFEIYGQCGMFAVDLTNEKFKVPKIKDGAVIQQALSDSELGKSYNAGLPNATGIIAVTSGSSTDVQFLVDDSDDIEQEGALYVSRSRTSYGIGKTSNSHSRQPADISLDLSRSDSIYGNSQTVQPNAITLRYFVVVANGQINQSQMDWSAWASGLQNKLNKDHSNDEKPYITEVSDSSLLPSWYRVWSDGWCEQGGRSSDNVASTTISFLLEFNDTNYTITTSDTRAATTNSNTGGASYGAYIGSYTTKSFYLSLGKGDQKYAEWHACGYVKLSNV